MPSFEMDSASTMVRSAVGTATVRNTATTATGSVAETMAPNRSADASGNAPLSDSTPPMRPATKIETPGSLEDERWKKNEEHRRPEREGRLHVPERSREDTRRDQQHCRRNADPLGGDGDRQRRAEQRRELADAGGQRVFQAIFFAGNPTSGLYARAIAPQPQRRRSGEQPRGVRRLRLPQR